MPKRKAIPLERLVRFCDQTFKPRARPDWKGAHNGLQVQNRGPLRKIAAAVDARRATIERAGQEGANFLLVHHGLFWSDTVPWTGPRYRLLRLLVEQDLAVYSLHLPLDEHPRYGNNVLLCKALGFRNLKPFFTTHERKIGFQTLTSLNRDALARRLEKATGSPPRLLPGGPATCRRVGVVTGGAGAELSQAATEGADTLITGEGPHWTHTMADDLGLNVFYAGHYATETFGVRAFAGALSERFGLPWVFLDHPTGL